MNLPGGDALAWRAAAIIFEHLERIEAQHKPGYEPKAFTDLPPVAQRVFFAAQAEVVRLTVAVLLKDQVHAVSAYDGCMGAAYERLIHRYAHEELDYRIPYQLEAPVHERDAEADASY